MNGLLRVSGVLVVVLCVGFFALPLTAGEPSVNFTVRKKVPLPEPAPPEPVPVAPAESEPAPAVEPIPVVPEPPAVPPVESATNPSADLQPAPVPVPTTELVPSTETVWLEEEHSHPPGDGVQSHTVTFPEPLPIRATQMLIQQVWLDPRNPPRGIALEFQRADGETAGVYWEGEEEVFNPAEHEDLWYYGMLPELGQWIPLEILAEDLGMEEAQISGLSFSTFGGRVLWGKASIKEAPPLEEAPAESPEVNSNRDSTKTP